MSGEKYIKTRDLPNPRFIQPDLDGFLQAETEAKQAMIDETTRQVHLARQFIRFEKAQKICKNEGTKKLLEKCKCETLKLMQR